MKPAAAVAFGSLCLRPRKGHQHLPRRDHGIGIGDVAAGDVGRRAVRGLRHRLALADAEAGRQAQPADQSGADVGEDVAELIAGHHHVVLLRRHHQLHRDGVDHRFFEFHVGIVARDLAAFLGEHAAGEPIDRLLVRGGHLLARPRARDLERFARDPVRALARDHAHGDGDVVVRPELRRARHHRFGIEHALGQFAQEHDVDVLVDRRHARIGARRADGGEQLVFLAHRRHHPGGIVARIGGMPDRPHDPAVEFPQRRLGGRRQRIAFHLVARLADRQWMPVDGEAGARRRGLHHLDGLRHDLKADVVAE